MSGALAADPSATFGFGAFGDAFRHLALGWAVPEPTHRWTTEEESLILLPRPAEPGDYLLRIAGFPALLPGRVSAQRVYVTVNRVLVGRARMAAQGVIECRVPWSAIGHAVWMSVVLLLPDAFRARDFAPAGDPRRLGLAVTEMSLLRLRGAPKAPASPSPRRARKPAEPPVAAKPAPDHLHMPAFVGGRPDLPAPESDEAPLAEQLLEFESLGLDPEFGLAQRKAGAEPLGLLRFAEAGFDTVIGALEAGFEGIAEPGNVGIALDEREFVAPGAREFIVTDRRHGLRWHSWTYEGRANPRQVQERETRQLDFLRSKLLQDLHGGHKLLVFKRDTPLDEAEIDRLRQALHPFGASHLLLAEAADAAHPAGMVETLAPGLMRGRVARFAQAADRSDLALESWVAMARTAHRMWRRALTG